MFKRRIVIHSADEARRELNRFKADLPAASLPLEQSQLLKDQVQTTLLQLEQQLSPGLARQVSADRLFETDHYSVSIKVRYGTETLLEKLRRILGL